MPEGEGAFDGGGSIRWEVKALVDDGTKFSSDPDGSGNRGRKTKGVDKAEGTIFRIILKVPEDGTAPAFLAQFNVAPNARNEIVLTLSRERRKDQIRVVWPELVGVQSV